MVLIQILIIGWISDLLARIAVAFACWNFFIVFKLNNQKKRGGGGKSVSYTRMLANESIHNVSLFFFLLKTAKSSESIATFYCIKEI